MRLSAAKMPKATRFVCSQCGNSFVLELFLQQDSQLCCLLCNSQAAALTEISELKAEVARLKDELQEVRKLVQDDKAVKVTSTSKDEDENRTAVTDSDDGFQVVKNGVKVNANRKTSATIALQNRFAALQETESQQDVVLVGDSLVRGQGFEFCREKPSRKLRCYPGKKIEDIYERVDHLVENSKEDTLFVSVVGTNNLRHDNATDIIEKYRGLMKEFTDRKRKIAVCSILPRYDVGTDTFRKMSVVNRQVQALCRQENMLFFDLWHHFSQDRTLYARDGIHLNCVGKARLGRVIGECIANIPPPPRNTGNGSSENDEVTDSVASVAVAVDVIDNNTAPDSEDIDRQGEAGPSSSSSVPVTNGEETQGENFH